MGERGVFHREPVLHGSQNQLLSKWVALGKQYLSFLCQSIIKTAVEMVRQLRNSVC